MCLRTTRNTPWIAEKDIKVIKVLNKDNFSPYQNHEYLPGMHYTLDEYFFAIEHSYGVGFSVDEGYHAYDPSKIDIKTTGKDWYLSLRVESENTAKRTNYSIESTKLVLMTIPKGAKYFVGIHGDIVSDQIITGSLRSVSLERFKAIKKKMRKV